ncbi:MAG: T9SS type A sorting domain-containing protein [Cyclobacteriaceae bacterium]|nr:T9SS type A sorting domain-containing protein [Cyclobacteriaceae bacterium]
MIRSILVVLLTSFSIFSFSQAIQSNGTGGGNWSNPATWVGGVVPTSANGAITIRTGDQVVVDTNFTIDQTTVQSGATLTVSTSAVLSINNGAGTDLIMNGTMVVEGVLIITQGCTHSGMTAANTSFAAGSIYRHRFTTSQGVIPLATWDQESTIEFDSYTAGITATLAGNWGQSFGNFRWSCPAQSGLTNLAGFLTSVNDMDIVNTNAQVLRLSVNQNPTIQIAGDLNISGTSQFDFATTGSNTVVNIGGSFNISTSSGSVRLNTSGNCIVNIDGDLTMNASGGTLSLSSGSGIGTLNIGGDFELVAGTIIETSSGSGAINFVGGNTHNFSSTGTISNVIAYGIGVDDRVIVLGESIIQGGAGSSLIVDGTLVVQSENNTGAIIVGTGAGVGNVRVSTRTFNEGSVLIYAGTGAQFMGNGQPADVGLTTIIDNSAGVSLNTSAATVTIGGNLTVENGDLTVELDNLVVNGTILLQGGDINFITTTAARTITSNGEINFAGGNIIVTSGTANANLIVNGDITGAGSIDFSGTQSNLIIGGSNDLSVDFPLTSPTTLEAVTITRAGGTVIFPQAVNITTLLTINDGTLIMNAALNAVDITMNAGNLIMNDALVVSDDLNMATGATLFFDDQTVELRSQFNNTLSGGLFSANSGSTLNILNTGVLGTLEFAPSGNTIGTFFIDRPTAGTLVTLNSTLNIETSFTLQNGDFLNTSGLTFANGATLTRNNLAAFSTGSVAPAGGPYDLIYSGAGMTTGVEAAGNLLNLTSNSSGTITLGGNVTVGSDLTVNTGTFTCAANQVETTNLVILTTFNAPNASGLLTISGNIINNGTFNRNAGTVVFNGNSSILGTNNVAFNNITISSTGILTPPATLNIHGAFTNNGNFNNGGLGTVAFLGTAGVPQVVSGTSVTNFGNINVSNTSAVPDVTIESNQNLLGVLTLNATVTFDADGSSGNSVFTLISTSDDPTQDAAIATLPGSANILGNVTVQRYMSIEGANNGRIYRYIASPVQNASVSQIQSFIPVTGTFSGTSSCTGCSTSPSMFRYDENVITDTNNSGQNDLDDGYVSFPVSTNTEILTPGRGYAIFVRANVPPVSTAGSALWAVRAPINRGTISFNSFVSFTSSGNVANDGWNLVGNPYPATIDWDAPTGWTRTNVTNAIYMRDNGQASTVYATYAGGVGINGGSRYIPMGQAFFIKSNGGGINFQANENVKVAGTQSTFFRENEVSDIIRITLKKDNLRDEAVVRFSNLASDGYDEGLDAFKLPNAGFNLASISDATKYAINAIPFSSCNSSISLNVSNATPGTYQLLFSDLQSFGVAPSINLIDNFTGVITSVSNNQTYTFTITGDPNSTGNRFKLSVEQPPINLALSVEGANTVCKDSSFNIKVDQSEVGVSYYAGINGLQVSDKVLGNGGTLFIDVPMNQLNSGANSISIFGQRSGCAAIPLNSTISVAVENVYQIQSKTDGLTCQPGSVTLQATGATGSGRYRWYATVDSVDPVMETATGTFTTPILDKSRSYYVSVVNGLGCEGNRVEVRATVENFEPVELSEITHGVLKSSYATGNKWYFNDQLMAGLNSQTISVTEPGLYRVEVVVGACTTSDVFEFIVTGTEANSGTIIYYPNPLTDQLIIELTGKQVNSIDIITNTGKVLNQIKVAERDDKVEIDFTDKPAGLYLIRLNNKNSVSTFKIIKQ